MLAFNVIQYILSIGVRGGGSALSLVLNIVMARLLGVTAYGYYMTALAVALILGTLASRGVNKLLTRELAGGASAQVALRNELTSWAVRRVALGIFVASLVYLGWVILVQSGHTANISRSLLALPGALIVGMTAICIGESGALNGFLAPLRGQSLMAIVRNTGVLILTGFFYLTCHGPQTTLQALWLQVGGLALACLVGLYWLRTLPAPSVDAAPTDTANSTQVRARNKSWGCAARSFLLMALVAVLIDRIDVVLVSALAGSSEAGIYAAGARLGQMAQLVALAVIYVLQPHIASAYRTGDTERVRHNFRNAFLFVAIIAVVQSIICVRFASELVGVFGHSYSASASSFAWVATAYALWALSSPLSALMSMVGYERIVAIIGCITLVVDVGIATVLVPLYGAVGAGVAIFGAYALNLPLLGFFVLRTKIFAPKK